MHQSPSPAAAAVSGVLRQRDELGERGSELRERGGGGGGDRRGAADGAGRAPAQPGVEAHEVERVAALGHHALHLALPVLAEADRAGGLGVGPRGGPGEGRLGEGGDHGGVEPDGRGRRRGTRAPGGGAWGVVLRDEDEAGHGDGDVARAGGGGGRVAPRVDRPLARRRPHAAAEAEVGDEEEGREEDEEAERDGDGVAEPERGERVDERHSGVGGGGGGGETVGRNGMASREAAGGGRGVEWGEEWGYLFVWGGGRRLGFPESWIW